MSDREKLIDAIADIIDYIPFDIIEEVVDHLISNGVTVQKWIPVSERLPTKGKYLCLCDGDAKTSYIKICSFADNLYAVDEFDFYDYENVAGFFDYDSEYGYFRQNNVTHWMPLPEPPKECE